MCHMQIFVKNSKQKQYFNISTFCIFLKQGILTFEFWVTVQFYKNLNWPMLNAQCNDKWQSSTYI